MAASSAGARTAPRFLRLSEPWRRTQETAFKGDSALCSGRKTSSRGRRMGRKPLRAISSATLREDGPELGRLLASLEAVLPLREPSGLGAPAMRAHVLGRPEGTTGEIVAVLTAATDAAPVGRRRA